MPRFNMILEEQLSDVRSSEAAFRVKIENLGATSLDVRRISPRIPEGVIILEVKDPSSDAARSRHKRLCQEMTKLLGYHILYTSKSARETRLQQDKQLIADVVKEFNTIWRLYFSMFTGKMAKRFQERREQLAAQGFIVSNREDADIALKELLHTCEDTSLFNQMFMAKYAQIVAIESALDKGQESSALATIESDSFFAATYVLRFPRTALNPAKFSFSVEAALAEHDSSKEFLRSTTTTVEISARPYVLTFISIISALLGVTVKFSIDKTANLQIGSFFLELGRTIVTGQGISAMVLSLVLFNIYEHVDFGEKVKLRVGWRSAMLIGVVCGLFNERVIAALKTLVGA